MKKKTMNKVTLLLLTAICLPFIGLSPASAKDVVPSEEASDSGYEYGGVYDQRLPKIGQKITVYSGDRMMKQAGGIWRDCLKQEPYRKPFRAGATRSLSWLLLLALYWLSP